jgi:hypothetical protein
MASTEYCLTHRDCYECRHGRTGFQKLAAYEDAEEQGRLVVLPLRPDTELWLNDNGIPQKAHITFFTVCGDEISMFIAIDKSSCTGDEYTYSDIGKTAFLSRAEAEAALAAQEGEQNETM